MIINDLLRKNIRSLKPYTSARLEHNEAGHIYLDANENSLGSVTGEDLNRYPDPLQKELKNTIAGVKHIKSDQVFLGNGSDEAIDLLIRAVCEPGHDKILICPPTYGVYQVSAAINNVPVVEVPLNKHFDLDLHRVLLNIDSAVKLIFLCSPNNPTGNLISKKALSSLLEKFSGIIVIDEAYIDFSTEPGWISSLSDYPNLVILQTFSKAWGLANIRLGMAFGNPDLIRVLSMIKYPYNVSGHTIKTGLRALRRNTEKENMIHNILAERKNLEKSLRELSIVEHIFPSQANFLLVRFADSQSVYKHLRRNGILVRDRSTAYNCKNCLRITVGNKNENLKLIQQLTHLGN